MSMEKKQLSKESSLRTVVHFLKPRCLASCSPGTISTKHHASRWHYHANPIYDRCPHPVPEEIQPNSSRQAGDSSMWPRFLNLYHDSPLAT